jgi:ATP phosphoribosyltransferase
MTPLKSSSYLTTKKKKNKTRKLRIQRIATKKRKKIKKKNLFLVMFLDSKTSEAINLCTILRTFTVMNTTKLHLQEVVLSAKTQFSITPTEQNQDTQDY